LSEVIDLNISNVKKVQVLVFPCGSENATEIYKSLRYSVHVNISGASSVDDHGRFSFDRYFGGLPSIHDEDFDDIFSSLIARENIDVVFATHDTVCAYLAPKAQKMGFFLINGDAESNAIARQKSSTYETFSGLPWVPKVYSSIETIGEWPIIIKPDFGQGGQGVTLARDFERARALSLEISNPVFVEYLPGDELTVDCFTDRKKRLVHVGARTRERVKAGISMRSRIINSSPIVNNIAEEINTRVNFRGPWFFQLKQDKCGNWKLLEISCRVAGAMVSQRARGINLPLMAIQDYLDRDVLPLPNDDIALVDRCIETKIEFKYEFESVYIDLDDTLIINGKAAHEVVSFLYKMLEDGKKIILITRHEGEIAQTLAAVRISDKLFDEIIHLTDGQSKADYVKQKSIFIDNHFPERLAVARKVSVPVFDVDALQFFL
jgi:hypothetical protein